MDKAQARRSIEVLIKKYEAVKNSGQIKKYSEEDTKKGFIQPLFEALGWNFLDRNEVSSEEYVKSAGFIDYGFYLHGRAKFFLEAKALGEDLHRISYADQSIKYSWNKGVTWAILTDFESIKIFNAEAVSDYLGDKLVFEIPYHEYLSRFEQLLQLSKEAFLTNSLDTYAESIGKKLQRIPVTELLYKDLNECRSILLNAFKKWNSDKGIDDGQFEEGVQKLIDRLIFIRVLEDRGIEDSTLRSLVRTWESSGETGKITLFASMIPKFRELDAIYNSDIFSPHPFEKWDEFSHVTKEIIEILYGKKGYYEYDFKAMPADVLGNVYENYLGYILSKAQKGTAITKDSKKRKEQGIYYTPSFIVDYIVENTLKPVLDKCRSVADLKKIKVLDPACGSGSFLIKALDVINDKYKEFGSKGDEYTKLTILMDNLYGVDLDEQAVEIARLNLLINALDKKMPLPSLSHNIKNGNSLISGTKEELNKYFGKEFRDKKPFNWVEEFPEVFKQGGFDVIVGNPPYVDSESMTKTSPEEREYINNKYETAKGNWDIFIPFWELAFKLLNKGGVASYITPNKWVSIRYGKSLRAYLQDYVFKVCNCKNVKVFAAGNTPIILFVKKTIVEDHSVELCSFNKSFIAEDNGRINKDLITSEDWGILLSKNIQLVLKLLASRMKVRDYFTSENPFIVSEAYLLKNILSEYQSNINMKDFLKFVNTGTVDKYTSLWDVSTTVYLKDKYQKPVVNKEKFKNLFPRRYIQMTVDKIIISGMRNFESFLDDGEVIAGKSTVILKSKGRASDLIYILGILNSWVIKFYIKEVYSALGIDGGISFTPNLVESLPIPELSAIKKSNVASLVKSMILLKQDLKKLPENSEKWNITKSEIEKLNKKIDEDVYKLYGLTPEEIAIVEKS